MLLVGGVNMDKDIVLKKNKNIVSRLIAGEMVLVPISRSSSENNCIYTLNEPATRVWELIDGKRKLTAIIEVLAQEFTSDSRDIEKELNKLLKEFVEIKACLKG
jgi:hypothetical protein